MAHDYIKNQEKVKQSAGDLELKKQRAKDLEDNAVRLKNEIENLAEGCQ